MVGVAEGLSACRQAENPILKFDQTGAGYLRPRSGAGSVVWCAELFGRRVMKATHDGTLFVMGKKGEVELWSDYIKHHDEIAIA